MRIYPMEKLKNLEKTNWCSRNGIYNTEQRFMTQRDESLLIVTN